MLLFKKKFLDAIRRGEKTQTIRLWKFCQFAAGQRSYIPGVGYIRIESADEVTLESLTDDDARPDGFATADALRTEINSLYATHLRQGQKAYRIRFSLISGDSRKVIRTKPVATKVEPPAKPAPRAAWKHPASAPNPATSPRPMMLLPADGFPLDHGRSN
jgi:hypothetical protein